MSKSICFCSSTHETKYSSKDKDISMMTTDQQQVDHQIIRSDTSTEMNH
ncbi:hypothetical protein SynMITS9220_01758 [Synechococcus sp. MIT S9220]|nr:hypothetical protein SynMITS9220_01758 [Synechococcus sp. MIT S9220]